MRKRAKTNLPKIKHEKEYSFVLNRIDILMKRTPPLISINSIRLRDLVKSISTYEEKNYKIEKPDIM